MRIDDPKEAMRRASALAETTKLLGEVMEAFPTGPVREAVSRVLAVSRDRSATVTRPQSESDGGDVR